MNKKQLLKRLASVVCGFALGLPVLFAQNITVTGTVTDAQKEPIIGAAGDNQWHGDGRGR